MVSCASTLPLYMVTGVVCLASTIAWWQPQSVINYEEICTPEFCYGLDYKSIADMYYNGFFLTRWELMQKLSQRRWNKRSQTRVRRDSLWENTDYDYCCPTIKSYMNRSHLVNTDGETKAIVHMRFLDPPRYQFVPHAECPPNIGGCWDMDSSCQIQTITVELLVYKMNQGQSTWPWQWPFEFNSFDVPGYCSCRSNRLNP